MSTPRSVSNNDITTLLANGPQSVAELCLSLQRAQSRVENRLDMLLAARVVCIDPLDLSETRYMLTDQAKHSRSGPIQTSIAGARYVPSTVTAITGYSAKMREFRDLCMLVRR